MQDIDLSRYLQPVLASEVVRYVGEPLAVVVAGDPYLAEDRPGAADAEPTEAEIRELVAANLCRCTGYQGIVEAVLATARARRKRDSP